MTRLALALAAVALVVAPAARAAEVPPPRLDERSATSAVLATQKVAAWREVARRLAHEIKNPLTPIQLSAERMRRKLTDLDPPLQDLVQECTATIVGEVESLKGLVDEFSQFARMPAPRAVPVDLPALINETLALYDGLFTGVRFERRLEPSVVDVRADPEQLKRVLINLIDKVVGPYAYKGPPLVDITRISIGPVFISGHRLVAAGVAVAVIAAVALVVRYSYWGRQIQAVAQNRLGASLAGIDTAKASAIVFALAGGLAAISGALLANIFNPRDRDGNGTIDEIDKTLPISERFFSGGSTTLRGFSFEEAGPRQVVIPEGEFRDQDKNIVFLNPFTVPVGGNALAVVNLEARVPLTRAVQVVPFYDGGNVFRRVGDLFGKEDTTPVAPGDIIGAINKANLRAHWTNTVGLGFRLQTPFGGALAVDYGFLLNPPEFLIPQRGPTSLFDGTPAVFRLHRGNLHFRITQTF